MCLKWERPKIPHILHIHHNTHDADADAFAKEHIYQKVLNKTFHLHKPSARKLM